MFMQVDPKFHFLENELIENGLRFSIYVNYEDGGCYSQGRSELDREMMEWCRQTVNPVPWTESKFSDWNFRHRDMWSAFSFRTKSHALMFKTVFA